jgi:hypothetical protein
MSAFYLNRHCEATQSPRQSSMSARRSGLLRYARNDEAAILFEGSVG